MRGDRHRSNERASFTMMLMMMEISSVSRVLSLSLSLSLPLFGSELSDIIFSFELYQQRSEIQYSWFPNSEEIAVLSILYNRYFGMADEQKNMPEITLLL